MKVLDPGHVFLLDSLDESDPTVILPPLAFVKREGDDYPGNEGHHSGTTIQEVLRALIARLKYVRDQSFQMGDPDSITDDSRVIMRLRESLRILELRAARRHGREINQRDLGWSLAPENLPTCPICGHVEPEKHRHA